MQYLQYQLHVSASTLAIIRLAFNLSRDYTICMVYFGEGETRTPFTIVGSMKIRTLDRVIRLLTSIHMSVSKRFSTLSDT